MTNGRIWTPIEIPMLRSTRIDIFCIITIAMNKFMMKNMSEAGRIKVDTRSNTTRNFIDTQQQVGNLVPLSSSSIL
jgi:hypothetical protein